MVELGVSAAEHMPAAPKLRRLYAADASTDFMLPSNSRTFSVMKSNGIETYGVSFHHPESISESEKEFCFPTVCKGKDGLRLFATPYLVDKDGIARYRQEPDKNNDFLQKVYHYDRKYYKVDGASGNQSDKLGDTKACITVRLTSDRKSTVPVS